MWTKVDDQFYMNPKIAAISRDEQDLYMAGNVYCNGQLTDGFIPQGALSMIFAWSKIEANEAKPEAIASHLVQQELWENAPGGYRVHDFLDWNPSKEEVLALRNARSEAGRHGGLRSGAVRAENRSKRSKIEANDEAKPQAKTKQNRTPTPYPYQRETSSGGSADPTLEGYLSVSVAQFSNRIHLIGSSTQRDEIEDRLKELYERSVPEWFDKAIKEAEDQNKRNWSYVRAILDRCLREGIAPDVKASTNGHSGGNARVPRGNRGLEALRLVQEEERRQANGEQ